MRALHLVLVTIAALLALGYPAQAHAGSGSERIELPIKDLLTPSVGFETKNEISVVLTGSLPNTCYLLADSQVQLVDAHTIRIRQYVFRDTTGLCAGPSLPAAEGAITPFTREVSVGHLPAGDYQFVYNKLNAGDQIRMVNVAQNVNPTIDSLPYAAVSNVQVPAQINGMDHIVVTIDGVLDSSCMTLDPNVRVIDENDVYILLPTIRVAVDKMCSQALIPFTKRVDLGLAKRPGTYLIHTRSMNGNAVNNVVDVMR